MFAASSWYIKGVLLLLFSILLAMTCAAMDAPEIVGIGILSKYYEPVEFDHQMHASIAADCSVCHHHTTGTGTMNNYCAKCHNQFEEMETVACVNCHSTESFSADSIHRQSQKDLFHIDVPGLVGTYHQNCLGCHTELAGPTDCQGCHARTEAGDKFYQSGKFAPKTTSD